MTVPGIGPIISSAMVAAIGNGTVFSRGRDFGAWLGLVPKQISSGDRTILGKTSKRGNRYLRRSMVSRVFEITAPQVLSSITIPKSSRSRRMQPARRGEEIPRTSNPSSTLRERERRARPES
jgi:Transposase IS116/IS110/IS902 family